MTRRAFIVVAQWPYRQLSDAGRLTWCCTGGTENHIGIFIPCCTADEIRAHSEPRVSHPTARGSTHVVFDYMMDLKPRFQSPDNDQYYTSSANVWLYPILDVDAAQVHAACVEVAQWAPTNRFCYRCNGLFWCWPLHCWCSDSPYIGPTTCVSLSMRIIARVRAGSKAPYLSDTATFKALGVPRFGCSNPCAPYMLSGLAPRAALEAMQQAVVVGRPVDGFEEAVQLCSGGGKGASLGTGVMYPLLSMMSR